MQLIQLQIIYIQVKSFFEERIVIDHMYACIYREKNLLQKKTKKNK